LLALLIVYTSSELYVLALWASGSRLIKEHIALAAEMSESEEKGVDQWSCVEQFPEHLKKYSLSPTLSKMLGI
jgi:hypothetical protein